MKSAHHVGHTVIQVKGAEAVNNEPTVLGGITSTMPNSTA